MLFENLVYFHPTSFGKLLRRRMEVMGRERTLLAPTILRHQIENLTGCHSIRMDPRLRPSLVALIIEDGPTMKFPPPGVDGLYGNGGQHQATCEKKDPAAHI